MIETFCYPEDIKSLLGLVPQISILHGRARRESDPVALWKN
jgi:hypothetical protein